MKAFDPQLLRELIELPFDGIKLPNYRKAANLSGAVVKLALLVVAVNQGVPITGRGVADRMGCSELTAYRALCGLGRLGLIHIESGQRRGIKGSAARRFKVDRDKARDLAVRHSLFAADKRSAQPVRGRLQTTYPGTKDA